MQNRTYEAAIDRIVESGAKVSYPVSIPPVSDLRIEGQQAAAILTSMPSSTLLLDKSSRNVGHDYGASIGRYLSTLDSQDVNSIEDIIQFNLLHADEELPESKW